MKLSDAFAVLGLPPGEKDPATIQSAYRQQLLQARQDSQTSRHHVDHGRVGGLPS